MSDDGMEPQHWEHVERIEGAFRERLRTKYPAGQREHGGQLWRKPMPAEAWAEAVDLVVYLATLREQLPHLRRMVDRLAEEPDPTIRRVLADEVMRFLQ